ncbi:vacuolar protein sorting/targeting protein PEP1 [Coemansia sp. RSA 1250]|nr:vacuolar protein sorting/targeting protein PEP1 [Coemansia sp. RSA 1250]
MKLTHIVSAVLAAAAAAGVEARDSAVAPTIQHTYFESALSKLLYFKNPEYLLGLDRTTGTVYHSSTHGSHWDAVKPIPGGKATRMYAHPFEPKVAYVLSDGTEHWVTHDEGKNWVAFSTPLPPTNSGERALSFHAQRTRWVLFIGEQCKEETVGWWPFPRLVCHDEAFYTRDGFEQAIKDHKNGDRTGQAVAPLLSSGRAVAKCLWARHTPEFQTMAEEAIFCTEIVTASKRSFADKRSLKSPAPWLANATQPSKVHWSSTLKQRSLADDLESILDGIASPTTSRLIFSEDFFETQNEVHFGSGNDGTSGDRAGGGVVAVSVVKDYILAAISHAHSDEMDLFVSQNGHEWAESHLPLPPGTREDAYTILESTKYAIFVDVMSSASSVAGSLFRSNSNGTYYTQSLEHTHRTSDGTVDVERVHGIEGVVIANQISNWDQAQHGDVLGRHQLELRSRISFDDGAHWRFLRAPEADADGKKYRCSETAWQSGECALHVHSVTSTHTPGRVFGTPAAPGIILAVGNVGSKLKEWTDCDTFMSRDGGITWTAARKGAHHVQIADAGAALVLASYQPTREIKYSVDGGQKWLTAELKDPVRVTSLVVDDDGLSPAVLIAGSVHDGPQAHEQALIAVDFSSVWKRQCNFNANDPQPTDDMERFVLNVRTDSDCIMGHRSEYVRRKPDATCAVRLDRVLDPQQTDCKCTEHDFECDYNYERDDNGKCQLVGNEVVPKGQCKHEGDRFMASPGYRLIPGNTCIRTDNDPDRPVEHPCPRVDHGSDDKNKGLGKVTHHTLRVKGDPHIMAFANSTAYLMMTSEQQLYRTDSEGSEWTEIDLAASTRDSKIGKPVYLTEHPYDSQRAYIYTENDALVFTKDRGVSWTRLRKLPARANELHIRPLLDFSAADPNWLLFMGGTKCPGCHTEVYVSQDNGDKWSQLATHATQCEFARTREFDALPAEAVVCAVVRGKGEQDERRIGQPVDVHVFTKPFHDRTHHTIEPPKECSINQFHVYDRFLVFSTTCGKELRLGVSDDGLDMHLARMPPGVQLHAQAFTLLAGDGVVLVDVAAGSGSSWGTLLASNSNGTHFRRILQHTNRAATGAVDVSRVAGLRGMLLANHVANADALDSGAHKRLRTVASWDDGRSWHALLPPSDSDCTDCSIHVIGRSAGARFGAGAAPGVMVAVGSVGTHLDGITHSHTYLSRDGGVSWMDVRKGISLHAIADHGALVVLADDTTPTDVLTYTADGGLTWNTYRFADTPVIVDSLAAGPNGGGQRVLVRARPLPRTDADAESTLLITVDFSHLHGRQCVLDDHDHTRSDFELWTPRWGTSRSDAPMCVLGAETAYWRRAPTAHCFVGDEFKPVRTRTRTCECSLADFECDEGFWRNDYGECVLDGPDPQQPQGCTDGSSYKGRSGYRRVPQTQCVGGTDLTAPVQRVCGRSGGVLAHAHAPEAAVSDVQFFKDSPHVLARTDAGTVLVSLDEGTKWTALPAPDNTSGKNAAANVPTTFTSIAMHPYFADYAYFIPHSGTVALYTEDSAQSTRLLRLPAPPARAVSDPLRFHPEYPDWMILLVQHDSQCAHVDSGRCRLEAYVTRDHGSNWSQLLSDPLANAGCVFLRTKRAHKPHRQTIACARHFDSGGDVMVSENWFRTRETLVPHATDFAQVGEFFLVSQSANDGRALSLFVSADGRSAAQAQFPGDRNTTGPAFTVLEPSDGVSYLDTMGRTHTTPGGTPMLHVTNSTTPGAEWGTLYTADADGALYRRSLEFVNRDESGLVDFERIRAIEGGALANIVANPAQTQTGASKRLQTKVTVDGGARWHYLRLATATKCRQTAPQSGECALHLHGYTEVSDPENIYSASGAVGLVMGIGNVGTHLGHMGQADTYLSDDGGATWSMVRRGPMWHKFGDHGALIVVAERLHPTSSVEYSLDRGRTWLTLPLPKEAHSIRVELLLNPPDATSRRFVLYGKVSGRAMLVSLDFTGAQPRSCVFNEDASKGDFERFAPQMVSPAHGDLCLLGRRTEYFRRKSSALCYVGDEFSPVRLLTHICECTEYDYECNHNFVREPTQDGSLGKCVLIEGMRPPRTNCTEGGSDYFKIEAAYRKIPQSICRNGLQLDRPTEVWCPGKARSVAILWSVLLPVVFLGLAYLGYKRWRDQYPYLRLEDIGTVVRPALHNLRPPGPQAGWVQQVQPVFTSALSTAGAIGGAAKESFLWALDKAAPYLPSSIQRWSYEHPPRWGAIPSLDGRSRRNIRRTDGERSRFTYQPLTTSEAAARIFGSYEDTQALEFSDHNEDLDEYDEVEAGFNHFLEEEEVLGNEGEADAQVVDRQVLFANAELSDEES